MFRNTLGSNFLQPGPRLSSFSLQGGEKKERVVTSIGQIKPGHFFIEMSQDPGFARKILVIDGPFKQKDGLYFYHFIDIRKEDEKKDPIVLLGYDLEVGLVPDFKGKLRKDYALYFTEDDPLSAKNLNLLRAELPSPKGK